MNHLMGYPSIGELEEALSDLPYGKAALEIAYDQAIQRIKAQQESCVQMAIRTLSWLTYSKRALAPEELQHALGTRPGMRKLNRKFLPALQTIDSLCAGLVVFNRNTGIIRLVHYTTQEFFMGNETLNNAELEITMTSIRYLSFEDFSSGRCTSYEEFMNRKQLYPLHEYCSINWASHASAAAAFFDSEELLDIITRFLEQEENLHASTQALLFGKPALSMSTLRYVPRRLTKVHVAAYHGLNDLLVVYQHLKEDMDPRDSEGNTPLMYAAQNGNLETTRLLLESRKINPDSKDQYGMSALLGGVASQNTAIIELLLSNGVSPNPEGEGNWSALCEASQMGNIEIMQLLIDHGAQIDYCCDDVEGFGTPLMLSWDSKNRNATLFLLDKGASPEIKNSFGETPLIEATRVGERDLVRLLLSRGVEVDPKGISDATPFLIAAKWGYLEILQDLLHAGADIEMTQYEKKTALLIACENGFDEMVAYLLDQGVDANVQDHSLENGLFHASRRGNVDMANRLLQAGVDPNHQNKDGATALFLAAERGHESLARCLLQHQIDLTIQNNALKTAIFVAVENAHFSFARQLIELGADFHCEDITGNTCLFYSCWSGNTDLAALLLDHGADPHHRNVLGETPLFFAARGGHCEIVKLLLDHNSEIDPRNLLGETPLLFAAQRLWAKWHDEPQAYDRVMALLLYRGAHPDPYPDPSVHPNLAELLKCASDTSSNPRPRLNQFQAARQIWGSRVQSYSGTQLSTFLNHLKGPGGGNFYVFRERWIARNASPLLVAVGGGHVDLVRMLLKREFNRDLPANQGKTLLAEAIEHKHLETTKLLLDEGPDPFASKQSFHHLIGCAARTGNTAILELLFELNSSFGPLDSSALSTATWNGHIEAARFFLNNGVDPYCPDHNSQTPFYYAVRDGKPEIVKLFLQHTKNAHEKDKHGRTLLFYAVQGRCVPVVQLLLQAGADPNTTEDGGQSPLLYDIRNTVRGIVPQTIHEQRLLELKSRNNTGSIGGNSPLFFAAGYGDESIVKQLLDYGADPDPADIFEERPILWAAGRGFEPVVKILLEKGANASHVDGSNMSPLLWAFGRQCEGLPEKITRGGENWNSQGQPDREAVVRLLLRYGADCNIADQNGQQPLMMAVELGSKSLVATLLRSGSDPNQRNKYGRTSLMTATVRGMGSIAAILLRAPGIDRDATDIFGRTSVTEAKERGEAQILSLLMEDSLDDQLINPSMILDRVESPHYDYEVCDVCGAHEIDEDRDAYHFLQCIGHRFCICNWCKQYGATCLADVHRVLES
jgi:ankyrin repeat protein